MIVWMIVSRIDDFFLINANATQKVPYLDLVANKMCNERKPRKSEPSRYIVD